MFSKFGHRPTLYRSCRGKALRLRALPVPHGEAVQPGRAQEVEARGHRRQGLERLRTMRPWIQVRKADSNRMSTYKKVVLLNLFYAPGMLPL